MRDLERLLHPKSIAVLGGSWAANVVRECDRIGFAGSIWPVHPTRDSVGGRRAFRSLAELPGPPDAAFVAVNRDATPAIVAELAAMGAGAVVCFASGFAEAGDGALQADLVQAAGDMPLLGPNCYGVINALDAAMIWPDQQGCVQVDRGVAILSQSSNIGITLSMQRAGLPVAYLGCLGNCAQTGVADLAAAMLADDRVTALGLYLEGVGDARAFAEVVETARRAGKGVAVLKAGRTEGGRAAAATHTAALAGEGAASSAYLAQIGAAEVTGLHEMVEVLKILHVHKPMELRKVVSVSCSGGEAGLMADAGVAHSFEFTALPEKTRRRLAQTLGPRVTLANPLDYHTYVWGNSEAMAEVFSAAAEPFDAALFVLDPPRPDRCERDSYNPAFSAIQAASRTGTPCFVVASLPDTLDEALSAELMEGNIVPLRGIEAGLSALEAANVGPGQAGWRPWSPRSMAATRILDEAEAKSRLDRAGLTVPKGVVADRPSQLDLVGLSEPFALKGLGFAHKSEAGAVRLHVTDPRAEPPIPGASAYLCEEMVTDGVAEMLVGLRADPVYGAALTLGAGGVTAELLGDTVTLIAPVTEAKLRAALRRLRLWPLFDGYRGRPRAAVDAAIAAILAVQALFERDPRLAEIEINPLILTETRAVVADALILETVT